MDAVKIELERRKESIAKGLKSMFKENMRVTDFNIPEADDNEAANIIVGILQASLDEIKEDVAKGKYDYY
jgi:hypothetical protein